MLDLEEYGSTYVTEGYVREQVALLGEHFACVRLPRALADWQDVYVVSPSPIAEPKPRRTPKGFVDHFAVDDAGVRVSGWATLVDEQAERVELRLDDELAGIATRFASRPDVAAWLGAESATEAGWEIVVPHAAVRSFRYQVATVSAFSRENEERILFHGTIDSLNGHVAREKVKDLQHQLAVRSQEIAQLSERVDATEIQRRLLEQQIAAMKQSRFWKARDQWFAIKRSVGLTDEL